MAGSRLLMELGRCCLEARGMRLGGLGRCAVAAAALGLVRSGPSGYLDDLRLPDPLAQIGRTQLTAGYQAAPRTFTAGAARGRSPTSA